jgi:ADP-ribosylglycohydrolase
MEDLADAVDELLSILRSNNRLVHPQLERPSHSFGAKCESLLEYVPRELFENILRLYQQRIEQQDHHPDCDTASDQVFLNRCVGSLVGMAVADGIGHNYEFMPATDTVGGPNGEDGPRLETTTITNKPTAIETNGQLDTYNYVLHQPLNVFQLKPGQWTDDASMGLCLADSLLMQDGYDGSHCRILYYNWWNNGLNNAFKFDNSRNKKSVGLGENISRSIKDLDQYYIENENENETKNENTADDDQQKLQEQIIPPQYQPPTGSKNQEDAGNGSLMRLAAVPVFFASDAKVAMRVAYESSLSTHPGPLAAEACSFLCFLIVSCLTRTPHRECESSTANEFLDERVVHYQRQLLEEQTQETCTARQKAAKQELYRLLCSSEPHTSTERCWNWKNDDELGDVRVQAKGGENHDRYRGCWPWKRRRGQEPKQRNAAASKVGLGIVQTLLNRGHTYNGYKVTDRYFGSFSLDALAIALYCFRSTSYFSDAVVRCINFRGDADTTAAITAQIAGAFYGHDNIPTKWKKDLKRWDGGGGFEFRAICLAVRGRQKATITTTQL